MELIIDFYKSLDTLNLIIFWGIIIVIILLLIFSCILINKNKKLKKLVETNSNKHEEELPIKKTEIEKVEDIKTIDKTESEFLPPLPEEPKETIIEQESTSKPIETEKEFVAEEHVMEYNKELSLTSNIKDNGEDKEEKTNRVVDVKPSYELPTGPYQRNVLREMSLSQTSPIGINRQESKVDKKIELAKDLEDSLNTEEIEISLSKKEDVKKEIIQNSSKNLDTQIKKELSSIETSSSRKTEITPEIKITPQVKNRETYEERKAIREEFVPNNKYNDSTLGTTAKELLNSQQRITEDEKEKSSSEKYLEEVSKKLAEAEIPDEIERTNYELQQEEDAIISYKELMEKKDSIQTIDEEDAVISIEELMNRNNQKKEEQVKEERKLYNLTEEEENDNFIKELKQFRKDL